MARGGSYALLSDREREVLRLLAQGHDAKSSAATLGVSVHAVNERLRDARRKLEVTSSREAARLVAEAERTGGQEIRDKDLGLGARAAGMAQRRRPALRYALVFLAGVVFMSIVLLAAILVLPSAPAGPPKVVATTPAQGSVIAPGPFVLSVTFDRPMRERSYSFVQVSSETYPDCDRFPSLSEDGRTYSLRCTAKPGRRYEVWFNRPPYLGFQSRAGEAAQPFRLLFSAR